MGGLFPGDSLDVPPSVTVDELDQFGAIHGSEVGMVCAKPVESFAMFANERDGARAGLPKRGDGFRQIAIPALGPQGRRCLDWLQAVADRHEKLPFAIRIRPPNNGLGAFDPIAMAGLEEDHVLNALEEGPTGAALVPRPVDGFEKTCETLLQIRGETQGYFFLTTGGGGGGAGSWSGMTSFVSDSGSGSGANVITDSVPNLR